MLKRIWAHIIAQEEQLLKVEYENFVNASYNYNTWGRSFIELPPV